MKKYIYITLFFLLASSGVQAQDNEHALAAAIDTIARVFPQDTIVKSLVEEVFQKHNKSAYLATRIAKSYYKYNEEDDIYKDTFHKMRRYHKNDTAYAFKFINRAIAIDPKYGDAYVLACDILDYDGKTEEGMKWLNRGLSYNNRDTSLYIAQAMILARTDIEAAKAKLQEMRKLDANFPVDLYIARIYDKMDVRGNEYRAQVAESYSKIDKSKMSRGDMETYVMSLFYSGRNEECNTQAEECLKIYPKSLALNRFYFRSLVPLKKYNDALTAFANLKASENAIVEIRDSINYAAALAGVKRYDEAMNLYDYILAKPNLSDNDKASTNYYVDQCMQSRVKDFTDVGDYQHAINVYSDFLEKRRSEGKLDDMMNYTMANIYISWAEELNGPEKEDKLLKADKILEEAIANIKIKSNATTFAAVRVFSIYFKLDPTAETGIGMPAINQYEHILTSDGGSPSGSNAQRLIMAYRYALSYYAYTQSDYDTAMSYADKILDIDPTNETATKFLGAMSKTRKRR